MVTKEKMGCMAGCSLFWITRETDEILLPPECSTCKKRPFCMICGALAIAEGQGCSYKKPEYLCRQTEVFLEEMEKEYRRLRC